MEHCVVASRVDLEHFYRQPPHLVFSAWSTSDALLRWARPGDDWVVDLMAFEFSVGGDQITKFGPPGGPTFFNRIRYQDIVQNARIIMTCQMTNGSAVLFAGVLSIEFLPEAGGCRLKLIEQGVFLDGHDRPENHVEGWTEMLCRLEGWLTAHLDNGS